MKLVGQPQGKTMANAEEKTKKMVLYVEDEPANREVAKLQLGRKYALLCAANDEEACRLLCRYKEAISVLLFDIELQDSRLSGLDLTKLIRGRLDRSSVPPYAKEVPILDTPVICVTAFGAQYPADVIKGAGVNEIIHKPVDFVELEMAMIRVHLGRFKKDG